MLGNPEVRGPQRPVATTRSDDLPDSFVPFESGGTITLAGPISVV